MKKRLSLFLCLLLIIGGVHGARKALVIGNAAYSDSPLRNPVNDANLISNTLRELDFDVILLTDADLQQMDTALNSFITALSSDDEALFYYSGHGANYNGDNYLIPLGRVFSAEEELKYYAFNSNLALERLQRARLSIMILDACRDNPYKGIRSGSRGLANMNGKAGSQYVIYSTEQGKTATDGTGSNSPFTESLVKHMKAPDRVEDVIKKVTAEVKSKTNDKQIPWAGGTLVENFYFTKAALATELRVTPRTQGLERMTGNLKIISDMELELYVDRMSVGKVRPGYSLNLTDQTIGDIIIEFFLENSKYGLKTSILENCTSALEIKRDALFKIRKDAFHLIIDSSPSEIELTFADYPYLKTTTPFVVYDPTPSSYEIRLKAPRYLDFKIKVETGKQRIVESNFELVAEFADLVINSDPSGSRLWLNGNDMGKTPLSFLGAQQGLEPGIWKLRLEPDDPMYLPVEKNLEINANQLYDENIKHPQISSGIQIKSDIYPISLSINEAKAITLKAAKDVKLPPGLYKISINFTGKDSRPIKSWKGEIAVTLEKMAALDVKLIPETGSLVFSSNIKDFDIKVIDTVTKKNTKLSKRSLVAYPGQFTLEALKWGHYIVKHDIEINEGLNAEHRLDFEPVPKSMLMRYSTWKAHHKISLASLALTAGLSAISYYFTDQAHQDYLIADTPLGAQEARRDFESNRNLFFGTCGLSLISTSYYIFSLTKTLQNRAVIEREMRSRLRK